MAMSSILSGAMGLDGNPSVDHAAALREQAERRRRETLDVIPCPGCGGEAWAEREPVTVYRDGMMRRFRAATCRAGCRTEIKGRNAMSGRPNTRPTRFEIEISSPEVVVETEKYAPERYRMERELVQDAMRACGVSQAAVARAARVSPSSFSTWLRTGERLSAEAVLRLKDWVSNDTKDVVIHEPESLPEGIMATRPERQIQEPVSAPISSPPDEPEPLPAKSLSPIGEAMAIHADRIASPADMMVRDIATKGALAALEQYGLELPEGAVLEISLGWGPADR